MSNYNHPYCTIDKLRISKANGIRFTYITDEEGSFFDGENIPDNTPYNDIENCGFVVPPFQQQIPCGGIARFQFQWCDDSTPYVHIYKNGEFDYELTPSLVLDGTYQIFEQELNFDETFCNSCVEIKICTKQENWDAIYLNSTDSFFVGKGNNFTEVALDSGYVAIDSYVYAVNSAVVVALSGGGTKVYSYINNILTTLITEPLFAGYYLYCLDNLNWVTKNNGTSAFSLVSINGVISLEDTGASHYPYGVVGLDISNVYQCNQSPFAIAQVRKRLSTGLWALVYSFANGQNFTSDIPSRMAITSNYIYVVYKQSGDAKVKRISLVDFSATDYTLEANNERGISVLSDTEIVAVTDTHVFFLIGSSYVQDTTFDTIRTSSGDTGATITDCYYDADGLVTITTTERIYQKQNGTWTTGVGGDYAVGNNFRQYSSRYRIESINHAKSEPIIVADDECLKKIEYWNDDDYDYQTFCQGFRNITYVQAQIIGFKPMEQSEVYVTSNNRKRVISSNLAKINSIDINYIPEYLHEILWRAFSMSYLEMDGKSYTKEGDYNIDENPTKYALYKANIELYENLYKFANSNCDESC
jgi:hypothetical protein